MGEKRIYQMKDLMQRFNITRKSIKYYEEKKLLSPKRNASGYRVYDGGDVQKLKMILDFRSMGFPLEKIELQGPDRKLENKLAEIGRLQDEIKKEIEELQKRQRKLETYERWLKAEERVTEHIIEDLRICIFSEEDEERYRNRVFIRDMTIFYLNEENEIVDTKEGFAIIPNEIPQEGSYCAKCEKNKTVHIPKAYVCEWNGTDESELEEVVCEYQRNISMRGIQTQKITYGVKTLGRIDGTDCISCRIFIPITE